MTTGPEPAGAVSVRSNADSQPPAVRTFEVTVVTTRSGMIGFVIAAEDREAAIRTVREELASGEFVAPPEHCTDDIQTDIWAIRELS